MTFTHNEWLECSPYSPGEVWCYPRPLLAFRIDSDIHFVFRFVDIINKPGYGFVAPSLATTNGNFYFLKACLPEYYRPMAQEFFEYAK